MTDRGSPSKNGEPFTQKVPIIRMPEARPSAVTTLPLPPLWYEDSTQQRHFSRNQPSIVKHMSTRTLLSTEICHNEDSKQAVSAHSIHDRMALPTKKRARSSSHDNDDDNNNNNNNNANPSIPILSLSSLYARQRGIRRDLPDMKHSSLLAPPFKRMTLPATRKRTVPNNQRYTSRYITKDINKRKEREEQLVQEFSRKRPKITVDDPTPPLRPSTTKTTTIRKEDSKPFSFGSALADAANNGNSTIIPFGSTGTAVKDSKPVTIDTHSKPAFSFGGVTTTTTTTTTINDTIDPTSRDNTPAFSFGSKQPSEATAPLNTTPSLFSFGTTAAPPSFGTGSTTPAVVGGGAASQRRRAAKSRRKTMA